MNFTRRMQFFLLAFVLLFAQQVAVLHALSHTFTSPATQQEQDLPSAKTCSQCLALAEIQGAVPATPTPFVVARAGFVAAVFVPFSFLPQTALGFSARAPPVFL